MSRHVRTYPAQIRADKEPDGSHFEGHCAVFDSIDEYGTIMARGCFDRDLGEFRANGFVGGLNHNWDAPIGKPEAVDVDEKGLRVACNLTDTSHAMDVRKLLKDGICKKLSFGFEDLARQYLPDEKAVRSYWEGAGYSPGEADSERAKAGAMLFTRIRVFECSPVMVPGNRDADITEVRGDRRHPGTMPLDDHMLTVRAAVDLLCDRLTQLAALRADAGRHLPPERLAALAALHDRIDTTLAACQPRANLEDVAALRSELRDLRIFSLTET